MSIKFNEVTWYSKLGAVILFLVVVPILAFYIGGQYREVSLLSKGVTVVETHQSSSPTTNIQGTFSDPLNGTYTIDEEKITFNNGKAVESVAPGSAAQMETSIFGKPVYADLTGDGQNDAIFFVSQETGGTGIFFYVVAAVNKGGKYVGTDAVFIGDRIAPQNINTAGGVAIVNYADRAAGEAMAVQPSVGKSRFFTIKDGQLVEGKMKSATVQVR